MNQYSPILYSLSPFAPGKAEFWWSYIHMSTWYAQWMIKKERLGLLNNESTYKNTFFLAMSLKTRPAKCNGRKKTNWRMEILLSSVLYIWASTALRMTRLEPCLTLTHHRSLPNSDPFLKFRRTHYRHLKTKRKKEKRKWHNEKFCKKDGYVKVDSYRTIRQGGIDRKLKHTYVFKLN